MIPSDVWAELRIGQASFVTLRFHGFHIHRPMDRQTELPQAYSM